MQRQEPATAKETEGAESIGGVSVPDKAQRAARTRTEIVAIVLAAYDDANVTQYLDYPRESEVSTNYDAFMGARSR